MPTEKQIKYWESKKGNPALNKGKPSPLKGRKGLIPNETTRQKMRLARLGKPSWNKGKKCPDRAGENNNMWKGGITPINTAIRNSLEYKLWREAVFKRDNHTCVWCGLHSGNGKAVILNADHIKPFSLYPELRFAIDNGRTLCRECHSKTDTFMGRMRNYNK